MPAIPLSTPVHPGDRTPAVLNVPFAHPGKLTLTLKVNAKEEPMNKLIPGLRIAILSTGAMPLTLIHKYNHYL
ncbi:MAG: hypothetical protein OXI37_01965 [Gammaproteobacteria bacterium]|nr:hypothetical protein [Gammaproteobacteria bacterium]